MILYYDNKIFYFLLKFIGIERKYTMRNNNNVSTSLTSLTRLE
jgi:hypothetical protein